MNGNDHFYPIDVSSKFAICGLPIRCDTYKTCSFGCAYCFANNRKIMEFRKDLKTANLEWLKKKLVKVYDEKNIEPSNFLEMLLRDGITWHCGGMSDPFQPIEKELAITSSMLEITNAYDVSILFSTKTDDPYHYQNLKPELHAFQLSITNTCNRTDIEPNVSSIEKRYELYKKLKGMGFKVGIRIQPFIPGVSGPEIVDLFCDADYFTIEGLKIVPQNIEQKEYVLKTLGLERDMFTQMGLLNIKPEIRSKLYVDTILALEGYGLPYSIADNDMHYISKSKCCCGEPLIKKSTDFNTTAMLYKNRNYTLEDVLTSVADLKQCKANNLFTSNRQEGCVTVEEFYRARFNRASSIFSKGFLYYPKPVTVRQTLLEDYYYELEAGD